MSEFFSQKVSLAHSVILLFLLATLAIALAKKVGFFVLEEPEHKILPRVKFYDVIFAFLIYLTSSYLINFFYVYGTRFLKIFGFSLDFPLFFLQFLNLLLIFITIGVYCSLKKQSGFLKSIFKRPQAKASFASDFLWGIGTWFVAFPVAIFMSQLMEAFVTVLYPGIDVPHQLAIDFIRQTFGHPYYFTLAIFSVVVLAPIVEELLFRGFLQTWLQKYLSKYFSLILTSILFSFFHFSFDQKLGNIPLLTSLFALSYFLGFIYERQNSLIAPITLHALFNGVSLVFLYLTSEGATI